MVMLEARGPPDVRKSGGACALPRRGLVSCACRPTARGTGGASTGAHGPGPREPSTHTRVRASGVARGPAGTCGCACGPCGCRVCRSPRPAAAQISAVPRGIRRARSPSRASLPRGARIHLDSDFSGYLSIKRTFYSARDAASTRERRFRFPDSAFSTPIPPLYTGTGPPTVRCCAPPRL